MTEPNPQLQLPRQQMRRLGYETIDMLVAHMAELADLPQGGPETRAKLEQLLPAELPTGPRDPQEVLAEVGEVILKHQMHTQHPRFFGFVPSPSNYVGVLADSLASGFNVFAGTWLEGSAAAVVELRLVRWLADALGMPDSAGGIFTTGGSMANMTALATARSARLGEHRDNAIVYASEEAHSSLARGLGFLGFSPQQYCQLASDDAFRLRPSDLRARIAADRANGSHPFAVVANAGSTNTGAIDPLAELADVCADEGLWLHVDGAFGAAAALVPEERARLAGIERADSVMVDPHKWLFQPYEIGCLLVRDREVLHRAFFTRPPYLDDTAGDETEINFCEYGPQLTRSFKALKLWLTLQVFGTDSFEAAIRRGLTLTRDAAEIVQSMRDWQLMAPPGLGVVAFRFAPEELSAEDTDRINAAISVRLRQSGLAFVSTSQLRGRTILRVCPLNPRTSRKDLEMTFAELDRLARNDVC